MTVLSETGSPAWGSHPVSQILFPSPPGSMWKPLGSNAILRVLGPVLGPATRHECTQVPRAETRGWASLWLPVPRGRRKGKLPFDLIGQVPALDKHKAGGGGWKKAIKTKQNKTKIHPCSDSVGQTRGTGVTEVSGPRNLTLKPRGPEKRGWGAQQPHRGPESGCRLRPRLCRSHQVTVLIGFLQPMARLRPTRSWDRW